MEGRISSSHSRESQRWQHPETHHTPAGSNQAVRQGGFGRPAAAAPALRRPPPAGSPSPSQPQSSLQHPWAFPVLPPSEPAPHGHLLLAPRVSQSCSPVAVSHPPPCPAVTCLLEDACHDVGVAPDAPKVVVDAVDHQVLQQLLGHQACSSVGARARVWVACPSGCPQWLPSVGCPLWAATGAAVTGQAQEVWDPWGPG